MNQVGPTYGRMGSLEISSTLQEMYVGPNGKLTFITGWTTSSQALQRATKVGRLQPGCCYRLYSQLMTMSERNPLANIFTCSPKVR